MRDLNKPTTHKFLDRYDRQINFVINDNKLSMKQDSVSLLLLNIEISKREKLRIPVLLIFRVYLKTLMIAILFYGHTTQVLLILILFII